MNYVPVPSFEEFKKSQGLTNKTLDMDDMDKMYRVAKNEFQQRGDPEQVAALLNEIGRVSASLQDQERSRVAANREQLPTDAEMAATKLTGGELVSKSSNDEPIAAVLENQPAPTTTDVADLPGKVSEEKPFDLTENTVRPEPAIETPTQKDISRALEGVTLPGDKPEAKKKRDDPDVASLLHQLGGHVSDIGGHLGSKHASRVGGMISAAGSVMKIADMLGGFGRNDAEAGDAAEAVGPDEAKATAPEKLLGGTPPIVSEDESIGGGVPSVFDTISGGATQHGGGAGGDRQAQEGGSELHSAITELIDAVKKLTEEMQRQHGKKGGDGDMMPEGGSFGGSAGAGLMGTLGEALGISPGEIQLIVTMMRMLAMAA